MLAEMIKQWGLPGGTLIVMLVLGATALDQINREELLQVKNFIRGLPQDAFLIADKLVLGFNSVFGVWNYQGMHLPSIGRSFLVSVTTTFIAVMFFIGILAQEAHLTTSGGGFLNWKLAIIARDVNRETSINILSIILAIIIVNPLIDYIAYIKTRYVLDKLNFLARGSSTLKVVPGMTAILAIDFILATVLILILFPVAMRITNGVYSFISGQGVFSPFPEDYLKSAFLDEEFFSGYLSGRGKTGFSGAFVYASYATSVWIWIVSTGCIIGRWIGLVAGLNPFRGYYERQIELRPFQTATLLTVVAIFIPIWIAMALKLDFGLLAWFSGKLLFIVETVRSLLLNFVRLPVRSFIYYERKRAARTAVRTPQRRMIHSAFLRFLAQSL